MAKIKFIKILPVASSLQSLDILLRGIKVELEKYFFSSIFSQKVVQISQLLCQFDQFSRSVKVRTYAVL